MDTETIEKLLLERFEDKWSIGAAYTIAFAIYYLAKVIERKHFPVPIITQNNDLYNI